MAKTGILLINTGTPERPEVDAIREYLRCMLSDPMLISTPRIIWNPILNHCILPSRPKKTVGVYRRMWTDEGSEFIAASEAQVSAIGEELSARGFNEGDFEVFLAMRYSEPTIERQLCAMGKRDFARVIAVPLYPQYVKVCAGTCFKEVDRCLAQFAEEGWHPELVKVESFYEDDAYLDALAASVRANWEYRPGRKLVVSFHSTLVRDIENGDPYLKQTRATAQALASRLGIADEDWTLAFQSRFDSRKWLQPATVDVLQAWAQEGVEDVCAICPGFVAENIESKIETGETLRDVFLEAAGEGARYTYVPTLNADEGLITAVCNAIERVVGE